LRKISSLRLPVLQHRLQSLWHYYREAETVYDVHSPYLSSLLAATLLDDRSYYAFKPIEQARYFWATQNQIVKTHDLGAGSRASATAQQTTRLLARRVAVPAEVGRFFFRLALFAKPDNIIELGTNLGISTLYWHGSDRRRPLYTVEGNPHLVQLAQRTWQLGRAQATLKPYLGDFATILPEILDQVPQIGLLSIDGDHRGSATLDYFERALPKLRNDSIVLIGDIHWSPDMEGAWRQLQAHPRVRASLDFYHFGLLLFRPEFQQPEHHTIIRRRYKPWRLGFFQ
jgi:predicted O-methyltransferase YrrM